LLQLEFTNPDEKEKSNFKFVHVLRELSQTRSLVNSKGVEIPFVLESRFVTLIIPVKSGKADLARKFLAKYSQTCLSEQSGMTIPI